MWDILMENLGTVGVSIFLLVILALVIRSMIRNRKSGKSSCGCGCEHCASSGICHSQERTRKK
ncbi:FeoB-associated Cys-rich membrane protein [Hominifimenecus sp. rT4P-3]|uniref:FeoB-associated Cys-rich membrane protein n=1 Tax=Hominifimenecus sp. rT4P-3 TaxID=3242979 RepID=UPI003DA5DD9D